MSETVDPGLVVRLKTDAAGNPSFVMGRTKRHYRIVLEIENAPEDAYLAQVELDKKTYHDSVRNLERAPDGRFRLETTTYGDYPVAVHLYRTGGYDVFFNETIAKALRRSTAASPPAIAQAVEDITNG